MGIVSRALLKHRVNPARFGRVCLEESNHRLPTPVPLDAALERILQEKTEQKQPGTVTPDTRNGSACTSRDSLRDLDEGGDSSPGLGSEEIGDVGQQRGHLGPLAFLVDMEIANGGQPSQTTRADSPEVVPEREFDDDQEGKLSYPPLTSSLKNNIRGTRRIRLYES
jgi:hypothetical protein